MRKVGLPEFTAVLGRVYPVTYRKVQEWASDDVLPTWPRRRRERRYKVRIGDQLRRFLLDLGLSESAADDLIRVLSENK
jgi:hypothetical protein